MGEPREVERVNYRVVLRGIVYTEVDMLARDETEAARLAEAWADGKTQPEQVNAIDFNPAGWEAHDVDVSEDQG